MQFDELETEGAQPARKKLSVESSFWLGILIVFGIPGCFILITGAREFGFFSPQPSDAQIAQLLERHRDEFDRLVEMLETDTAIHNVDPLEFNSRDGLSYARWQEYKRVLDEIDLPHGISRWGDDSAHFVVWTRGIAVSGSTKGLAYREETPALLLKSLDTAKDLPPKEFGYWHIEGNWYVFLQYDP